MKTPLFILGFLLCSVSFLQASDKADSLALAYYHLSEYYAYRDYDSTRYYCRKGLEYADPSEAEPYLLLLNNLADAYISSGNLDEGIRLMQHALDEAYRLDYSPIFRATALTSMGVAYRLHEKSDSALYCYNLALELLQGQQAYDEETHLLTSIAVLYANTARLDEALQYALRAIQAADRCADIDMVFYAYTTAGSIRVLRGEQEEAVRLIHPVLSKARLQQKPGMELKCMTFLLGMFQRSGQRDSLDYYIRQANRLLPRVSPHSIEAQGYRETLYMILSDMGRYRESLRIQQEMLEDSTQYILGQFDRLYLYMARNYHALHEHEQAVHYYELALATADSLHAADIESQLSELTAKYETQEKELEIARLSEQHLMQQTRTLQWMVLASVLFFLLLTAALWYLYHRRRVRKEEELKIARSYIDGMECERIRLAKDLHDGVCNDLLGIGMEVQSLLPPVDSTHQVVGLIEQVRQEVRHISHELMPPKFKHTTLDEMIEDYLGRFRMHHQVVINFSKQSKERDWHEIPDSIAYETYRVMQELLSNIIRHAGTTHVDVFLCLTSTSLRLHIDNDGHAFSSGGVFRGIGLDTIHERAKALGGILHTEIGHEAQSFRLEVPLSAKNHIDGD